MKKLIDYFNKMDRNSKPLKIMAPQNSIKEELWNSPDDRWSRKAKHRITVNEAEVIDDIKWKKGDKALFEKNEVIIKIPNGSKDTVGILVENKIKMVHKSRVKEILDESVIGGIKPINPITRMMQLSGVSVSETSNVVEEDEDTVENNEPTISETGVMGGLKPIPPINRMMQLAGLESGTVTQESTENLISEDTENSFFEQLVNNQLNGEFKNNPNAARLAAIGEVLIGLQDLVDDVEKDAGQLSNDTVTRLNTLKAMGASFINDARSMLKLNG